MNDINQENIGAADGTVTGFQTMSSSIKSADNYTRWILSSFSGCFGKTLLEIGTGHGNFRRWLTGTDRYVTVDIDSEVVERARFADVTGDEFPGKAGRDTYNTVMCFNVLEHIGDDRQAVKNMLRVLKKDGYLLLLTPAFQCLYSDLDRLVGHHRRYRKKDLVEILPAGGCDIEKIEYFNAVGGFGWWLNKFTTHDDIDSDAVNFQVVFFDKYILPLSRMVNFATRYFFGQSLVCIARKK